MRNQAIDSSERWGVKYITGNMIKWHGYKLSVFVKHIDMHTALVPGTPVILLEILLNKRDKIQ